MALNVWQVWGFDLVVLFYLRCRIVMTTKQNSFVGIHKNVLGDLHIVFHGAKKRKNIYSKQIREKKIEVNLAFLFSFFLLLFYSYVYTPVSWIEQCSISNIPLNCRTKFLQYDVLVALQYCTVVKLVHSTNL